MFSLYDASGQTTNPILLKEVIVKGKYPPIVIKEDTLEYRADEYHLMRNSSAEDLLRRLPGIEIDMDGNITFMGKRIRKVRINGKDVFINDIKSLTRLFPADMIEKIQLIDDYGIMARVIGRKTGEPEQVINIQTVMNKILQGKGIAGAGNNGRYNAAVMANYFNDQQQLLINGTSNNINTLTGNNTNTNGNINYQHTISKALSVNSGISSGHTTNELLSHSFINNITSEGLLHVDNSSNNNSNNNNHSFTGEANYIPNPTTFINVMINTTLNNTASGSQFTAIQSGLQRKDQLTVNNISSHEPTWSGNLSASHRFNKSGRIVSFNFSVIKINNDNKQNSYDSLRYYNNDTAIGDSLLHQSLYKKNHNLITKPEISFVQPLNTVSSLELKYGVTSTIIKNEQEIQWGEKYIDSLSSKYKYTRLQHQVSFNYQRKKGKFDYTLGALFQPSILQTGITRTQRIAPLVPIVNMQYKLPKSAITFIYSGESIFPSYQQLQSVPDLSNNQFPIIGNPDLQSSLTHSILLSYRAVKTSTLLLLFAASYTKDKIVTNSLLVKDSFNTVKQETHFLNTNGDYFFRFLYSWSRRFNNGKYNLLFNGNNTYNNSILYMNNVRRTTHNLASTLSAKASITRDWLEITGVVNYTYNRNVYILSENNITNLGTWVFGLNGKVNFAKTLILAADVSKQMNTGYAIGTNPLLLNASIEKLLFKNKLTVRLQGSNLLNEAALLSQSISGNAITQKQDNLAERYFILTIQYDLRKTFKK
ncbi:outer membrane beta-barrel protein [Chitinophaga sp. YR573]|uniref:outer membrane beta-barrel protein n=1 Tax=Chitinophaga sp. YR573 TaxID=1881040 RepID=UPI0015A5EC41|nr:outer membrane beta-barrel protein [Chitinophaga sp. YR573]